MKMFRVFDNVVNLSQRPTLQLAVAMKI